MSWLSRPSLGPWPLPLLPLLVLSSPDLPTLQPRELQRARGPLPTCQALLLSAAIKAQPFLPARIGPRRGWPCTFQAICFSTRWHSFLEVGRARQPGFMDAATELIPEGSRTAPMSWNRSVLHPPHPGTHPSPSSSSPFLFFLLLSALFRSGVSSLLASPRLPGRRGVVWVHTLNTLRPVTTKTSHDVLSTFTILCWAAFTTILATERGGTGRVSPMGTFPELSETQRLPATHCSYTMPGSIAVPVSVSETEPSNTGRG